MLRVLALHLHHNFGHPIAVPAHSQALADVLVGAISAVALQPLLCHDGVHGSCQAQAQAQAAAALLRRLQPPQLQALALRGFTGAQAQQLPTWLQELAAGRSPSCLASVQRLDVDVAELTAEDAATLLRLFPGLRSAGFKAHLPAALGAALADGCPALERLELDFRPCGTPGGPDGIDCRPRPAASGWPASDTADMNDAVLLGLVSATSLRLQHLRVARSASPAGVQLHFGHAKVFGITSLRSLEWGFAWDWAQLLPQLPRGLPHLSSLTLCVAQRTYQPPAPGAFHGCFPFLAQLHIVQVVSSSLWVDVLAQLPSLHTLTARGFQTLSNRQLPPLPALRVARVASQGAHLWWPLERALRALPGLTLLDVREV